MENSHEKAQLDIHTSNLRLISRQIDGCGGALFAPQHLIHQCMSVMKNIRELDPAQDESFPLNENTEVYIDGLQEQARKKIEAISLSPKIEKDDRLKRLIEIHCINIVHLENQLASEENNNKLPDEVLKNMIQEEQNNIDSLI
ncbi:MAG: hypothetical protein UW35_C0032G0008 [Candidatus Collierbacteria bacterium GW2011_GWF2_44_15]|uniref:Uncharacterized protein n=5 Tax=Candidatus Collieribacteriota TaxID=1752725 RepID=A0A0G1HGY3_9BACT|nr:MAG: hypothetical protein UW23_C0021G0008 [Candidatus Collierbacteria bacterium GW2011_GWA1_44_12]KKT37840.1 MAG: hypothetical protein UW26_C0024G0003 [Candidatus Collierbacteria bacterium GW2011_GWF1_44_12]KKT45788.1 MAG: hypothetical protein UW35_C0032G0008 [Candidatus Collierbacteria bacterium GW2011_GWF2_44_15]KKT97954.1 MAG: hypothetical protein UW99_C0028G0011 [Candidatus Collierbacteria bacterium GW2011_GWC2_45_15]KKU28393.1 MAG: hypothetical protein UX41_C0036G0006 [Candidatus Collie